MAPVSGLLLMIFAATTIDLSTTLGCLTLAVDCEFLGVTSVRLGAWMFFVCWQPFLLLAYQASRDAAHNIDGLVVLNLREFVLKKAHVSCWQQ